MSFCPCNKFEHIGTGGIKISSGGSLVTQSPIGGGVVIKSDGSEVSASLPGDGHTAIWLLDLQYVGDAGEILDVTGHVPNLDGVGGGGLEEYCPESNQESESNFKCLYTESFTTGFQYLSFPADDIPANQAFAVSIWVKFPIGEAVDLWKRNPIFARGTGFKLYLNVDGRLIADVTGPDSATDAVWSGIVPRDQWHHVAASFAPGESLRLFLNGVQVGNRATEITSLEGLGSIQIARLDNGQGYIGRMTDCRLHPESRDVDWWQNEFDNYCVPGYFTASA